MPTFMLPSITGANKLLNPNGGNETVVRQIAMHGGDGPANQECIMLERLVAGGGSGRWSFMRDLVTGAP